MADDDRVAVRTYVPRYQKELWTDHAEDLEMSQSEFVRTMVQAGRTDFEVPESGGNESQDSDQSTTKDGAFEPRIRTVLEREGVLDWDGLVGALVDDVEDDLDAALQRLQDENQIQYSGRDGGYVLVTNE